MTRYVGVAARLAAAIVCFAPLSGEAQPSAAVAAPTPVATSLVAASTTKHALRFGDGGLSYHATWAEKVLRNEQGAPEATISGTSYIRSDVADAALRPVIFFFNGGPGASSSPLHFSAFGPRRRTNENSGEIVDNHSTLLDAADLVFVDPVGTGFSRELREGGGKPYWSVTGDPRAALDYVRGWIAAHGRESSPLFIAGQSYGGMRAALMAKDMGDLNVAGFILISPALDMSGASGSDNSHVFSLPSMAVAAWTHGQAGHRARDAADVWDEARAFAEREYLVALHQGAALPPKERAHLARRMSKMIGLSAEKIEAGNLRIETQDFLESLLADEKKIVGRLDSRVSAPAREPLNPDRPPAANDPSLGLGRSNVIKSDWAAAYFRDELGVVTTRDYFSVTLDVNFNWNWRGSYPDRGLESTAHLNAAPHIAALMKEKPKLRVLLVGGYYDLAVPLLAPRYAVAHAGLPLDRVDMIALPGSHSPYDDAQSLASLSARVREFLKEAGVGR